MKHRDDINSTNDPAANAAADEELAAKRCRWDATGTGRCTNVGVQLAQWGRGKSSWFCEHHWDLREEMRPADPAAVNAAMRAIEKINDCPHTDARCKRQCMHRTAYEQRFAR